MSTALVGRPRARESRLHGRGASVGLVAAALVVLLVALAASLAIGARVTPPRAVLDALLAFDPTDPDQLVVHDQRVARTLIGLLAGASLGVAGVLMQGLTRNPLADPGLLGVNAGASLAVLGAITLLGVATPAGYVWFAFAGAGAAAALVVLVGSGGRSGGDPARLALTGATVGAGLTSVSLLVLTTDTRALSNYRFWAVGSLTGRDFGVVAALVPFVLVGALLAAVAAGRLDMLALGEEAARALGHDVGTTRALALAATVALCGSATSMAGPLVFVGLVIPHVLRSLGVGDHRRLAALAAPLGATLLLTADVVGRVIALPGEVEAGTVVAAIGAPVMIGLVRRRPRTLR